MLPSLWEAITNMEERIILRVEQLANGDLVIVDQYNRILDNVLTMNINVQGPNPPVVTLELINMPINFNHIPNPGARYFSPERIRETQVKIETQLHGATTQPLLE